MNGFPLLPRTILGCDADFDSATIAVFGAPFDGTATYRPGSRFAPAAVRTESIGIETYSPYQDKDLADISVCDIGDLDLPFGNTGAALELIRKASGDIFAGGKKPVMIGGEHLVSLPVIEAALKRYPDLIVIHLDAHADLRGEYIGEKLSHSSVVRRVWELVGDGRIHQHGIRSGTREEFAFAKAHTVFYPFDLNGIEKTAKALQNKKAYLTIDLDVLDSSVFPGTGTPEAGGASFAELVKALLAMKPLDIVGADIVELAPHYDPSGCSTAAACKVLRELLLLMGA
jgi:agmatinase